MTDLQGGGLLGWWVSFCGEKNPQLKITEQAPSYLMEILEFPLVF